MNTILNWIIGLVVLFIGGLVAALKIQGGRLHKAQLALLAQSAIQGTEEAQKAYADARAAYLRAGGVLLLALCLALPVSSPAGGNPNLLPACQLALSACDKLATAQATEIKVLQKAANTNPPPSFWQSVPWPIWVLVGGIAGFGVGRVK